MNYKQKFFIEISDPELSKLLIDKDLIDEYMILPAIVIYEINLFSLNCMNIYADCMKFENTEELIAFIEKSMEDNLFYIYSVCKDDSNIILRYKNVGTDFNVVGKEYIIKQRMRDKKINMILC